MRQYRLNKNFKIRGSKTRTRKVREEALTRWSLEFFSGFGLLITVFCTRAILLQKCKVFTPLWL